MTNEQHQVAIMRRIASLITNAADLTRAVAYEDATYVRTNLSAIESQRAEIVLLIYDWKPGLLDASVREAVG